jgi:twitching motility two-component system response regulator PilG
MTEEHSETTAINGHDTAGDTAALRVLVVDDSATIRRSAESMLTTEGYDVVTAENGFEALSKKNNVEYRSTPVVMLTSKDGLFDQARGRVVGSDLYLTKPFTRDELLNAVKQHAAA